MYSLVPNRRGVGIVGGVGKIPKTYLAGGWNKWGGLENCLKFDRREGIEKDSKQCNFF